MMKNRRILWLLNHRTLMQAESNILINIGFEVFIPKIIPPSNFRSGSVTFEYDKTLSIPNVDIRTLNGFDFYNSFWSEEIIKLVNKYFGVVFTIIYERQFKEVIDFFEGQIILRAFGLENGRSYHNLIQDIYGREMLKYIRKVKHRFWFGQAYPHLIERERDVLSSQSIYLPIALPSDRYNNNWQGGLKKILFLAPSIGTNPYYTKIYNHFKEFFGDIPHVIIGHQDNDIPDTSVEGFVSDLRLDKLYETCAAFFYSSDEIFHLHYTPLEAMAAGLPVVYYKDSLLGRLFPDLSAGVVASVEDARRLLLLLVEGDHERIENIRSEQERITEFFDARRCQDVWTAQLKRSGILRSKLAEPLRTLSFAARKRFSRGPYAAWRSAEWAKASSGSCSHDGITFADELPACVVRTRGLSGQEPWGRWSDGAVVELVFSHRLPDDFTLTVEAFAHPANAGLPIKIVIGDVTQTVIFDETQSASCPIIFRIKRRTSTIKLLIPNPHSSERDRRGLGLGLIALKTDRLY